MPYGRRTFHISRTARALIIIVSRNLSFSTRECNRQTARRIVIAEKRVRHGITGSSSREPSLQNRRNGIVQILNAERPSIHQHCHDRFSSRYKTLHKFLLHSRKTEMATASGLTAEQRFFSDDSDNHITLQRGIYSRIES